MELAVVGLGRMGMNMAKRLLLGGHDVVAYNRSMEKTGEIVKEGAVGANSLEEVIEKLSSPRIIWLMLPAGTITASHVDVFKNLLSAGDVLVDGGNTYYKDDIQRAWDFQKKGIHYVDAGVSGGIWGLDIGYCLMIGGEKKVFHQLEPIFASLAPKDGYLHCGSAGAGHFMKMVHNGIEYGMMQAYAEGFEIIDSSDYSSCIDYAELSHLWNRGSVVRSWLLELAEDAFRKDAKLDNILGYVEDSGEGRWTIQQAVESGVAAPVTALSLFRRFESRNENAFANRVLAALRKEFGGHAVKNK